VRGEPFVRLVLPDEDDYFVLKPKHSGFYCTSLELLLEHLGAHSLILAGIAGNNCVLFTANDAYMRDFKLLVPSDCSASQLEEDNENALKQMEKVLKADIRPAEEVNLKALNAEEDESANYADKKTMSRSAFQGRNEKTPAA
jgi:nicotinamidase-related amidase